MLEEDINVHMLGVVMAQQFSLKAGLKNFGNDAGKVADKGTQQLQDKIAYLQVDTDKLTSQ